MSRGCVMCMGILWSSANLDITLEYTQRHVHEKMNVSRYLLASCSWDWSSCHANTCTQPGSQADSGSGLLLQSDMVMGLPQRGLRRPVQTKRSATMYSCAVGAIVARSEHSSTADDIQPKNLSREKHCFLEEPWRYMASNSLADMYI